MYKRIGILKAARNNRRLETNWEEVAVQAICPPPTGGFHLFDGERDPAVPMDSPVTALFRAESRNTNT